MVFRLYWLLGTTSCIQRQQQLAKSSSRHALSQLVSCRLFGGVKLDLISGKDASITFADIAGIDQVKQEIIELVAFLQNPKRFLDLGARSPAGVLLVGPPGTGWPLNLGHDVLELHTI